MSARKKLLERVIKYIRQNCKKIRNITTRHVFSEAPMRFDNVKVGTEITIFFGEEPTDV